VNETNFAAEFIVFIRAGAAGAIRAGAAGAILAVGATLPASAPAEIPSAEAYQIHCSGCHRPDGSGDVRVVPSLREIGPLLDVPGGREYLVRVPGVAQAPLDSAELAPLLNYVLREIAGAASFAPFTPSEVESLRRLPLREPAAERPTIP
jgi:mono/diheme cytochrome c family protein